MLPSEHYEQAHKSTLPYWHWPLIDLTTYRQLLFGNLAPSEYVLGNLLRSAIDRCGWRDAFGGTTPSWSLKRLNPADTEHRLAVLLYGSTECSISGDVTGGPPGIAAMLH